MRSRRFVASLPRRRREEWRRAALAPVLVGVGLVIAIISSLGAPLIPTIARADHVTLFTAEWVLTATLLVGAVATPVMGRLADGPHQRRVIVTALLVVVLGSVLSAVAGSFGGLVAGRGLEGVGLAVIPVTMAIARTHVPEQKISRTIAALSISTATGVGLGYPLTSAVSQALDYRAAFWLGAIVVAVSLLAVLAVVPDRRGAPRRRFDLFGVLALSTALTGIMVVLSEGGAWGWGSPQVVIILLVCAGALGRWTFHELRTTDPLVDLRQIKLRPVLTADVGIFLISVSMYLFIPIIVEFVQIQRSTGYGLSASVLVAGLLLTPLSIGTVAAGRRLPSFSRRFGTRAMIPIGALIFAASSLFFAWQHDALWPAFVSVGVAGVGVGFTYGAMPGFIITSVPAGETGSAMGFYQVLQRTGGSVGSALAAAVLSAFTHAGNRTPSAAGFDVALLIAAGLCAATAAISYALPGRAGARPTQGAAQGERDGELMTSEAQLGLAGAAVDPDQMPGS